MHLISGGSSGLGLEIAMILVAKGESVMITGRQREKLEFAKEKILETHPGGSVQIHAMNAAIDADVKGLIQRLTMEGAVIQTLFNVAGSAYYGNLEDVSRELIESVLESNLIGLALMTAQVSSYMKKEKTSPQRIVSVLSTAALKGKKHETLYNAAKWGARGFLESVREELEPTSIEVLNVFPGGMKTPFWDQSPSGYNIDTFMNPKDVAEMIVTAALSKALLVTDLTIGRPQRG